MMCAGVFVLVGVLGQAGGCKPSVVPVPASAHGHACGGAARVAGFFLFNAAFTHFPFVRVLKV